MSQTILIVDDFQNIRELLKNTLERKQYAIETAGNGQEALDILKEKAGDIDLVLTDFNMPVMNGNELLKAIKKDAELKHIPVMFLTTESCPEKMKSAKMNGLSAWVKKPYKLDAFVKQINHLISKNQVV